MWKRGNRRCEMKIHRNVANLKSIDMLYLDTRTKGRPVIICLHGRWGRAEVWAPFIERYGENYRVIAPDQRGHGFSGRPINANYTPKEMAGDIIELMDFLMIDSAIIVGHSMGGAVAGHLAALYPRYVKAVAILDKSAAGPSKAEELPADRSLLVDPVTKDWPMPFATLHEAMKFIKQASSSALEYQYIMNSLMEAADGYQMMFSTEAMALSIANYTDWFSLLPDIKCLTLLIRSGSREAVPDDDYARMQSLLPDCIAYEMSHPDHNVHLANEDEIFRYFDEFTSNICV